MIGGCEDFLVAVACSPSYYTVRIRYATFIYCIMHLLYSMVIVIYAVDCKKKK